MPSFTFFNSMSGLFVVHATGCSHCKREAQRSNGDGWVVEAESVDAAIAEEIADFQSQDQDFTEADFEVIACCRPRKSPAKPQGGMWIIVHTTPSGIEQIVSTGFATRDEARAARRQARRSGIVGTPGRLSTRLANWMDPIHA